MKNKEKEKIFIQAYNDYVEKVTPKHSCWKNMLNAGISGGIICLFGQAIKDICISNQMTEEKAALVTTLILILSSVILTCLNWVNVIIKYAGAGYLVPITGFANAIASCALEYKVEGQVFGIGSKIFTIAGSVILYGVFSSWCLGLIYWILSIW